MRADRLLALMLLLQTRGPMTAARLARELEVSRRTILRDVYALSVAGVPVRADGGRGGGISLDEGYRTTLTGMKPEEAATLFLGGNEAILKAVGLGDAARGSLLKLLAVLPPSGRASVDHLRGRILIDPAWWWSEAHDPPCWADLQRAVHEDRLIRVSYEQRAGGAVTRTLEPYSLVSKSSVWYLLARRAGVLRTYRVSRLRSLKLLDRRFRRPADFDLPAYWREHAQEFRSTLSGYAFTLRIRPDRLGFIQWLAAGRYEALEAPGERPEGWRTIRLHLETLELAKMLAFGLWPEAVVVEPAELRNALVSAAAGIAREAGWPRPRARPRRSPGSGRVASE